jgi:integrase
MARKPEVGNVQLYPDRPLRRDEKNGYVLKFYCPILGKRIRKNCGTKDRREARAILRECRERLLNGKYVASEGAITAKEELAIAPATSALPQAAQPNDRSWDECAEHYHGQHQRRRRRKSKEDSDSRLDIARRIFEARRQKRGLTPGVTVRECMTLESLEYLQDQLLDGAESNYDHRSPNTVNSMLGAIMAFVRYAYDHEWIDRVPPLRKLDVDEVMRGRPITAEEFELMLAAVPKVVGESPAGEWRFAMKILWDSGFRIGDLLDFSWDDNARIHPVWPRRQGQHPTLVIPSTQKNGKNEEVPLLPGLKKLLDTVPEKLRHGFVVSPPPAEYEMPSQTKPWFMPATSDLADMIQRYSNCAIAKACGVSDVTVKTWLIKLGLKRKGKGRRYRPEVPAEEIDQVRSHAVRRKHQNPTASGRITRERVSRVIAQIGEEAKVVVRQADKESGRRIKYASAHDLRRSCAERLINLGVSAETLMVIMRHKDFATTRNFYGARRAAQAAAAEVHQKLVVSEKADELVHEVEQLGKLSAQEMKTLKRLLRSLREPAGEDQSSP